MKKVKKRLFCLLCLLIMAMAATPQTVRAVEIIEDSYVTITFTANVPEGFDKDIWLKIKNSSTEIVRDLGLASSVDYTRPIMLPRNESHTIEVFIEDGNYITDLEESYIFATEETVEFTVSEAPAEQQEISSQEVPGETGTEIPHGEETDVEMDELTGLESADSVWERFVNACSVMEDNPDYESYVNIFSGALIKKGYLEDKETNTEETWDAMTPVDRYILHMAYTLPRNYLAKAKDEEDFLSYLDELRLLEDIEGGEQVRDAVIELWRWHYKYYLHTGTFYDFYADYDGEYEGTPLDGSGNTFQSDMDEIRQELSESEQEEIKEALEEEIPHGEEKENGLVAWAKNNIITLSILVIVGVALIVVTILVRRKNMQDKE